MSMATGTVPTIFEKQLAAFQKGVEDGFAGLVLPKFIARFVRLTVVPPQIRKGDQGVELHSDRLYRPQDKLLDCLQDGG